MARRGRSSESEELVSALRALEEIDLLNPIAAKIRLEFDPLIKAKESGLLEVDIFEQCSAVYLHALKQLPSVEQLTQRFLFDAALIQAIGVSWANSGFRIPSMILPRYHNSWHFRRVHLGPANLTITPAVDLIGFRGKPQISDVDLLDYAWLIHELGHSAHRANDTGFHEMATLTINAAVSKRIARTMSLRGGVLQRARKLADSMAQYWGPYHDRNSWALEIEADLFAAWSLGPAYAETFLHYVDNSSVDPFQISSEHPPYAIRIRALDEMCRKIGWTATAEQLAKKLSDWKRSNTGAWGMVCELNDDELITSLVFRTADIFVKGNLPLCTIDDLNVSQTRFREIDSMEFGTNLLLDAHTAHESMRPDEFRHWHDAVVHKLAESLTQ